MNVQSKEVGRFLADIIPHLDLSVSDLKKIDTDIDSTIDEEELFDGVMNRVEKDGYKDAQNMERVHKLDNPNIYRELIFEERYGDIPDEYAEDIKQSWISGFDRYIENK